jgi:replicative DNA helicase Mcm
MSQASSNQKHEIVENIEQLYRTYYHEDIGKLAGAYPNDRKSLTVDWSDIFRYDPELADDVVEKPEQLIEFFEQALRQYDVPIDVTFSDAHVRIINVRDTEQYEVGKTRQDNLGQFVGINGQVTKTSKTKPKTVEAAFECQRCGTLSRVPQVDNEFQEPHECQGCERQGPFRLNTEQSEFVDHQLVRIQQPPDQTHGAQGESMDVVLEDDLTNAVDPGDRVNTSGILRLEKDGGQDKTPTFETYLDANSTTVEQTDFEEIDVSEYKDEIEAIADDEPIEQLVNSLAPKIRGYEDIKEALMLQLFSGVRATYPDGSVDRGDFHLLLLGDPGCGKSSLLRAVESIAPRSTYASGKGASAAGMTGAAVRDDFGESEWSIEAGALAIANKGIACVDEIDKVDEDAVSSLHNTLESQTVEISKAGINGSLQAETALLAAGNPKYGRFDKHEAIADQIGLGPTLLSRFDLMFMLSDEPDKDEDRKTAEHMVQSRRKATKYTHQSGESDLGEIEPDIPKDVMRAYIAHAKQSVNPVINEDVQQKIVDWYTELRMANQESDGPVPVTPRKVEALERLCEASARARLSETVEAEDVERAGELVLKSMKDVGVDPDTGEFDADVVETGTSTAQRDRIKTLLDIIAELQQEYDRGAPLEDVLHEARKQEMGKNQTKHEIQKLLDKGDIYQNATDHYRTTEHTL